MKKGAMCVALSIATISVCAQTVQDDSLLVKHLDEVEVIATRATKTTPVAFTNITKQEIQKRNYGQDLPYLLSMTPSVITTSDAGTGIGYTSLRVRGTDASRINITANGIPMNDAESHQVYWVNVGDFASSLKDMQVQRGVGTSTNGAGAFGASVNMQTGELNMLPYVRLDASAGSYGTHKETLHIGTGLLHDHWAFDARLSNINTDGYIDRASVALNSYYLQGGWYGDGTSVKLIAFGGKEKTYHAWNYASKDEWAAYGRSYNSCGYMFTDAQGKDHYYEDQTDNYVQKNFQLLFNHDFNGQWNLNAALHYTKGDGYYQEYKRNRTLAEYGLEPFYVEDELVKKSDLVRKKAMDNGFGGGVFSLTYKGSIVNATLGGGFNRYDGDHFGRILWLKNYIGDLDVDRDYYFNNATKDDGNVYLKADFAIARGLNAYADLQYRHISYKIKGEGDNYDWFGRGAMQNLDINEQFDFFNPKFGLNWQINPAHRLFASFSVANKEPTRNQYTDGKFNVHPKAERLYDWELGYSFANSWLNVGANLYYMKYKDQLILTGELNEIGEALAANVPDSYRAGLELTAGVRFGGFSWDANATLSKNRIQDFTETLYENEDNTADTWVINHGDTHIAFSPSFIFNNRFAYSYKGFEAALQSQYVSRQYMSNADVKDHLMDAYFVSNLDLSYTFKMRGVKSMTIGATVYNLFNEEYENNGYAGSGFYYDNGEKVRYNYAGYAAQAPTNFLAHISLNF
ncbi:MAG: TonB-dependent receptor [Bacteroidaceae bacterium]|nr:TonB-dependent receptor [Bacteroidaceae bacterium]